MLKPKHLYTVKNYSWLVFPTKETVQSSAASRCVTKSDVGYFANYWSKELGCLVTWIEPNSNFMVLEVDGKFVHIVGDRVGWIVIFPSLRFCFVEITNESV